MESGKDEKGRGKEGESEGRIGEGKGKGIWHTQLLGRSTATEFARVFWPPSGQILRLLPIYCQPPVFELYCGRSPIYPHH